MAEENKDMEKINELIEVMKENELVEIEITHGEDKILLKRYQPQPPTINAVPMIRHNISPTDGAAAKTEATPLQQDDGLVEIKSPLVGTFYAKPSPDSDPFVEADSQIDPQTVVCIVEAMKVMNEIKAEIAGTVVEVLVSNGEAIEYGQTLFKVKPT